MAISYGYLLLSNMLTLFIGIRLIIIKDEWGDLTELLAVIYIMIVVAIPMLIDI